MNNAFTPPPAIQALIDSLEELLRFGYEQGNKIKITNISEDFRKATLFQMMGVVHHFTHGILVVAKKGLPEVGIVLLRTVLEANITTQYILLGDDDLRAKAYYADDEKDRKRFAERLLRFYDKYPEYEKRFTQKEELKGLIRRFDTSIQQLENETGQLSWPSLLDRIVAIDRQRGKPDNEFMYRTAYWLFSHFSHLSSRGLDSFLRANGDAVTFLIEPHSEGLDRLLMSAYQMYLGFLGTLNEQFGIPTTKELEPFNERLDLEHHN